MVITKKPEAFCLRRLCIPKVDTSWQMKKASILTVMQSKNSSPSSASTCQCSMDGWDNGAKLAQRPFEYSLSPPLTRVFFASSGHLVLWKLFSGGSYRGYPLRRHLCHLFNGFFFFQPQSSSNASDGSPLLSGSISTEKHTCVATWLFATSLNWRDPSWCLSNYHQQLKGNSCGMSSVSAPWSVCWLCSTCHIGSCSNARRSRFFIQQKKIRPFKPALDKVSNFVPLPQKKKIKETKR